MSLFEELKNTNQKSQNLDTCKRNARKFRDFLYFVF